MCCSIGRLPGTTAILGAVDRNCAGAIWPIATLPPWTSEAPTQPTDCSAPLARAERGLAVEAGGGAQFCLDAQELIVLGEAIGAAGRSGLDLAGGRRDSKIGDERVFGLARAV